MTLNARFIGAALIIATSVAVILSALFARASAAEQIHLTAALASTVGLVRDATVLKDVHRLSVSDRDVALGEVGVRSEDELRARIDHAQSDDRDEDALRHQAFTQARYLGYGLVLLVGALGFLSMCAGLLLMQGGAANEAVRV